MAGSDAGTGMIRTGSSSLLHRFFTASSYSLLGRIRRRMSKMFLRAFKEGVEAHR